MTRTEDLQKMRNDALNRLEHLERLVSDFKKVATQSQTEKHHLSEAAANTITITPDMNEAEIQLRIDMARANRAERHRQEVLEKASYYMSGVENSPVFHWCTQPSLASLKKQLEQKPPRYIKKYVDKLRNKIARYKRFDELFSQKILETLPCNWQQFYRSKEQGVAERRERESHKLKTVNEAIAYIEEITDTAREILERKRAFIAEHANEIPALIREATKLSREASRLQSEVIEMLRTAPRGLTGKQVERLIALILRHKKLETKNNSVVARLALLQPDNPSKDVQPFPSSNYALPSWIEVKVRNAERGEH